MCTYLSIYLSLYLALYNIYTYIYICIDAHTHTSRPTPDAVCVRSFEGPVRSSDHFQEPSKRSLVKLQRKALES